MKKNKRKLNYLLVIVLLLLVSVGYAILSTNLNIVGSSQISAPTWDIHWENVSVKSGSVSAQTPTIDTAKTTVNYSVTLTIPGDYFEFTVDAVNAGTIDGMISVVSNKLNGTEITTLPNYLEYKVTYEDDIDIAPNHLLESGTSEKYKVHVGYKKDISVSDIPATAQTLNLSFSVTYVQSDSNAVAIPHPQTVYTGHGRYGSEEPVWIGLPISNEISIYQTPEPAMADLKEKSGSNGDVPLFYKHTVSNNIVTDTSIGFVITPEMSQDNLGMTVGTYYLKGKKTHDVEHLGYLDNGHCISEYDDGNGNCIDPEYDNNKEILLRAFGSSNCTESSNNILCETTDYFADLNLRGDIRVGINNFMFCDFDSRGFSECNNFS